MSALSIARDRVQWYINELGARVVAESGIPSDRHHLGKLILQSLKDAPDSLLQIDAATNETEDYKSALQRSVQCAVALQKMGLKTEDNMILIAPNHIHLTVPFYAALYLGLGIAALDANSTIHELENLFKILQAKIIFCQQENVAAIRKTLSNVKLEATIVTFDDSEDCIQFSHLLEKYAHDADVQSFRASEIDPAETVALQLATSGTTGLRKIASLTHQNIMYSVSVLWSWSTQFPIPTRLALVSSPIQWLSAGYHFVFSSIFRYPRVQSSAGLTPATFMGIVNKYKPSYTVMTPHLLIMLTKPENVSKCNIDCFDTIIVGGSAVSKELLEGVQKITPKTNVVGLYGMSEIGGLGFYDEHPVPGSLGRPLGLYDYRLVNPVTKEDITEPHVHGELWLRGPSVFKGYYNQPETTKEALVEGGWLRTGDIFYRDEKYYFFFVERYKLLLQYRDRTVSPLEVESVIHAHPGVLDVAVTGLADREVGELPVACVVLKAGHVVTAQEIKDMVKNKLSDAKQLRGGVVFMEQLPMTSTMKVNRKLLKEMVPNLTKE